MAAEPFMTQTQHGSVMRLIEMFMQIVWKSVEHLLFSGGQVTLARYYRNIHQVEWTDIYILFISSLPDWVFIAMKPSLHYDYFCVLLLTCVMLAS